jgi:hypothetical protein
MKGHTMDEKEHDITPQEQDARARQALWTITRLSVGLALIVICVSSILALFISLFIPVGCETKHLLLSIGVSFFFIIGLSS